MFGLKLIRRDNLEKLRKEDWKSYYLNNFNPILVTLDKEISMENINDVEQSS